MLEEKWNEGAGGDERGNQFLGRYSNQGRTISFPRGNAADKYTCGSSSFYRCARLVTGHSRVHVCFLISSCCLAAHAPTGPFLIIPRSASSFVSGLMIIINRNYNRKGSFTGSKNQHPDFKGFLSAPLWKSRLLIIINLRLSKRFCTIRVVTK